MTLPRPPQLAGSVGTPESNAENARARLRAALGISGAQSPHPVGQALAGSSWTCMGPCVALKAGLVAAIRGRPVWRTSGTGIKNGSTDAQAVLDAYRAHGASFLQLLYGSFAVVVLDTTTRAALLAVDRVGIERLTYCLRGPELVFATSAEVVARSCGLEPRVRAQSLLSYLFFHMIPSPDTVFEGVRKIPPATAMLLRGEVLSEYHYWQPDFLEPPQQVESFAALKESLHDALAAGISAARPDERTGAFLSGGLDSSTVTGYLGKVTSRPPKTFSIGFGIDDYDELRYARIANAHFRCDPHEYEVRPEDIVDQFAAIAAEYDEPFGNASALPTLCCARLARNNGVDQLLAGDGGDELFAGNKRYAEQLIFERYQRVPRALRCGVVEPVLRATPAALRVWLARKALNYIAQANVPLPDRLESWNFLYRLGLDTVLHPDFAAAVDPSGPATSMRRVYAASPSRSLVNRMLHYDWRFTLADNDLRKVGSMCELAGIRVSYPMLHPDVIDVALRVSPRQKMRGTQLRTFYKRAMADFLPAEIIAKTKHGFGLPFGIWLQRSSRLAELINDNLASLRARRIIRPEYLDRLIQLHGQDDASYYGVMIWTLAMLEQWFREHRIAPV